MGSIHLRLLVGGESNGVDAVGTGEEPGARWVNLNVFPAGLLPSAGDELHLNALMLNA